MSRLIVDRARGIAMAAMLCLVALEAWGEEAPAQQRQCLDASSQPHGSYDLPRLLDMAQCLNPETREAWERTRQAELAVDLVRSSYAPQVSLEALGGFQRTPLPIPTTLLARGYFTADTREFIPSVGVKWLLFDFGRRAGLEATARANHAAAEVAYNGVQQRLVFSVTRAYYDYQSSRDQLRAADEAVTAAQTIQDATDAQRRHGRATVVAEAQAERQTALSRLNQVKANGAVRTAYAALIAAIGLSADTQLSIGGTQGQAMPSLPDEAVDHYVQKALAGRPDVRAAEARVKAAEGEVQSAHAAYRPVVSFSGRYYQNIGALSTDGSPYYSINKPGGAVFLNVELPLFDGGARSAQLSMAHSRVQAAQDQLDQVRDKVAQEVVKAYNDLRTSLEAYAEAQAFSHAARVAYEAALDAYQHGVGTYTDLANDEAVMAQSESALTSANADAQIAWMALALAAGDIRVTP
ncbi:TolC family protein [Dyella soli]|nr:TolC family protein [Dyella soli]